MKTARMTISISVDERRLLRPTRADRIRNALFGRPEQRCPYCNATDAQPATHIVEGRCAPDASGG